jgi:uncharacterized protein YoxC
MVDTTKELIQKNGDLSLQLTNTLNELDELKDKQQQLITFINEKINELFNMDEVEDMRQTLLDLSNELEVL